jgi:hypothetical protein
MYNKKNMNANRNCYILRRNCLLKHVTEGKNEGISDRKTRRKT